MNEALVRTVEQVRQVLAGTTQAVEFFRAADDDQRRYDWIQAVLGRLNYRYRQQRVVVSKTRGSKAASIGVRKAPTPDKRPGLIRIDSVHQGDLDGVKGL